MAATRYATFCLATVVTSKAMEALLEVSGSGAYRDSHPWLVARDLFLQAQQGNQQCALLFASQDEDKHCHFSHWADIEEIDVVELHRGQWESRCRFGQLKPVNPIWTEIDSVYMSPSAERLAREEQENIRVFRTSLDEHHIHPYAICETPVFILES